jgi:DNA-binding protein YbaB
MEDVLRQLRTEISNALAGAAELIESIPERRYEATSSDGMVTAVVSGSGGLLGVSVDPRARWELDNIALGEAVRDTVNAAEAKAAEALNGSLGNISIHDVSLDSVLKKSGR